MQPVLSAQSLFLETRLLLRNLTLSLILLLLFPANELRQVKQTLNVKGILTSEYPRGGSDVCGTGSLSSRIFR